MLVGKKVILRTLREADLDRLFDQAADVRESEDLCLYSLLRSDCGPLKERLGWEVELPGPSKGER